MNVPFTATFVDPEALIGKLSIAPGSSVADFGCGSGYFSVAFARAVGREGRVIALDILPSALEAVVSRAKIAGLSNLSAKRANLEKENGSGIDAGSIDWVIIKDILFQNKRKDVILREAHRILRMGGHMLLMEWKEEGSSVGPESHLRVSQEEVVRLLGSVGFSLKQDLSVGDFHYAFLLEK